jgi:hypothetical protein
VLGYVSEGVEKDDVRKFSALGFQLLEIQLERNAYDIEVNVESFHVKRRCLDFPKLTLVEMSRVDGASLIIEEPYCPPVRGYQTRNTPQKRSREEEEERKVFWTYSSGATNLFR